MYMRFVQLEVRNSMIEAFQRFYEFRLTPALMNEPGCLFARLIQSDSNPGEFLSFTLWTSPEAASSYESSGHFDSLIEENEPFLEDRTEWKIQLSEDNTLEYAPVRERPSVQAMPVAAGTTHADPTKKIGTDMYVRILSAKIIAGEFANLKKIYDDEIAPELLKVYGCQGAYLIGSPDSEEGLSVTIWEDKDKGDAYESSGKFNELVALAQPYLSSVYQWKMSLDRTRRERTHSSDDLSVRGYHIVTGENMGG
jgi:quinol monooxygenase YgiN